MRTAFIAFVLACALGYISFVQRVEHTSQLDKDHQESTRSATSRNIDITAEYMEIMLDEDQKFQLRLEQANTLTELLALVECYISEDSSEAHRIAEKLARLYPSEALNYYHARPTDAEMNQKMYEWILAIWADSDFKSCFSYLRNNPNISETNLNGLWFDLTKNEDAPKLKIYSDVFQTLSEKMQYHLIESGETSNQLLQALLPTIKGQKLAGLVRKEIEDRAPKTEAIVQEAPNPPSAEENANKQIETLKERWEKELPSEEIIIAAIRSHSSIEHQMDLLECAIKPNEDKDQNASAWLERITHLLQQVNLMPEYIPNYPSKNEKTYQQKIEEWLPAQPMKWQRAWSDDVVRELNPEEAFEWIKKIKTESLQNDMREQVWEQYINDSAKEAASALMTQATDEEKELFFPDTIYRWALHDYQSAKTWLDAQPESEIKNQALKKLEADE